jgi:hypothetical protein
MSSYDQKDAKASNALHVEHLDQAEKSSLSVSSQHLEDLDSIEQTESGKYAWLVAITAGVGGLLFGVTLLNECETAN